MTTKRIKAIERVSECNRYSDAFLKNANKSTKSLVKKMNIFFLNYQHETDQN